MAEPWRNMQDATLAQTVKNICERDPRYRAEAYMFLLESLDFTARMMNKTAKSGRERHVAGRELLEGVRQYALQEYGPMALSVLDSWGIRRTEDFGEVVFNLVEAGKLRRTEEDSRADFANGYDFSEAFTMPFLPAVPPAEKADPRAARRSPDGAARSSEELPPDA